MPKTSKPRTPKPAAINWKPDYLDKSGNSIQESLDGLLRIKCQTKCEGVSMPKRYQVYVFQKGTWRKLWEGRSCMGADMFARQYAHNWDADND